jgi:ribosome-binding factor A
MGARRRTRIESNNTMKSNRKRRGQPRREAGRDGASALTNTYFGEGRGNGLDTKTLQMCRQIQRRLDMALGGELENPNLQGLWVRDVLPEPGGRSLLVEVIVDDPQRLGAVMRDLESAKTTLRRAAAEAIHRKRTPNLHFVVLPAAVVKEEDGW